jgi:hypothetical protein
VVAGRYLGGGSVDEADECVSDFDWSELSAEEPGVVAPMADEKLMFGPSVGGSEGTALWLEDWSDTLVGRDHVKPREEVVVCQSGDALRGGEATTEVGVELGGIVADAFV